MSKVFDPKNIVWETEDSSSQGNKSLNSEQDSEFSKLLSDNNLRPKEAPKRAPLKVGGKITGTILMLSEGSQDVIVNLGNKSVGILPYSEIKSSDKYSSLKVGDLISAIIVGRSGSEYTLSINGSASLKSEEDIKTAYANNLAVRGKVSAENKGGFDVIIFGKKAFCPISAMDLKPISDKSIYVNKDFDFIITQYEDSNLVVSRTQLLRLKEKDALIQLEHDLSSDPFLELSGTVTKVQNFGAFVELENGLEGLVHKSELSWGKVSDVSDTVQVGDKLRVKVLKISNENGKARISLSVKSVSQDPWESIDEKISISQLINGTVTKLERFGVFVELSPGIEGLLPIGELNSTKKIKHPSDILKVGDKISVYVKEIDRLKRRISLTLSSEQGSSAEDSPREWIAKKDNKGLGIFGKLLQDELNKHSK